MQYTSIFFFSCKNRKFHPKKIDIFNIFAQNIECGYTSELIDLKVKIDIGYERGENSPTEHRKILGCYLYMSLKPLKKT